MNDDRSPERLRGGNNGLGPESGDVSPGSGVPSEREGRRAPTTVIAAAGGPEDGTHPRPTVPEPPGPSTAAVHPSPSGSTGLESTRTIDHSPGARPSTTTEETVDQPPSAGPGADPTPIDPARDYDGPETASFTAEAAIRGNRAPGRPDPARIAIEGYRILGELGRGGMGVVYEAHHLRLGRRVALKVILAGGHADPELLARFEDEARAVAHLLHPNIVQIYEIGDSGGLPYFSLEFVEGGTLAQQVSGTPQDPSWSAGMVRTLALAMHAAHLKGIIHRDLKPANVLLTPEGQPKITDFGLAKQLEGDSGQTRSGAVMGTPSFMSPEQAWGKNREVGPRSDIYALGAILYHLLTGRPPFQGSTTLGTLEQVRIKEPVAPTQLQPKVARDLETICLKCLQKEPGRRYDTADELAEDLRRFLDGEPIKARPVSAPERLARWCRRNPKVAALSASVLALLVAVAGISSVSAVRLESLNETLGETVEELGRSNEDLKVANRVAEEKTQEALSALEQALDQNFRGLEAWRTLGRLTMEDLRKIPGTQEVRLRFIEQIQDGVLDQVDGMQPYYQAARNVDNPRKADMVMGQTHKLVGDILLDTGKVDAALRLYEQQGEIAERLLAEVPGEYGYMAFLASNRRALGYLKQYHLVDHLDALRLYEEALELTRRWLATGNEPDEARADIAGLLGRIGLVYLQLFEPLQALRHFEQELAAREQLPQWKLRETEVIRQQAETHARMAEIAVQLGDLDRARSHYDRSFDLREELARANPDDYAVLRDVYRAFNNYGHQNLMEHENPKAAAENYRRALEGFERLRRLQDTPQAREDIGRACYYLATALLRTGEQDEADVYYRRCLELRRELAKGTEHKGPNIDLMVALGRCGEHAEAAEIARSAIETEPKNRHVAYQAACGFALAAGAVERVGDDEELRDAYVDDALAALRRLVEGGGVTPRTLEREPDLDPIKERPGFRLLLMDLAFPDDVFEPSA